MRDKLLHRKFSCRTMDLQPLAVVAFLCLCQAASVAAKDGFILTVPKTLRESTTSELCATVFGDGPKSINISFIQPKEGNTVMVFEEKYYPGVQKCTEFIPPPMGFYKLLVTNQTDLLHDMVDVNVGKPTPVTLVQTDKPQYKPGSEVKFRVLTLLSNLKPRVGNINSIFIKDPNGIRVKQFMNVETNGLLSLDFQLSSEAKLGIWKIHVNMSMPLDGMPPRKPSVTSFEVAEYVLPRYEVTVKPPSYILSDTETVTGSVCAKYTYGKDVVGFLDLKVCWGYGPHENEGCEHEIVELSGCYEFSVNMSALLMSTSPRWGARLQVSASVTEGGTGAVVNASHSGPGVTYSPLKIKIDDFTNGYFKPRIPYIGKVTVTLPDNTPAVGEQISIWASNDARDVKYANNFTTGADGTFTFSLCGSFSEDTTNIQIEAIATRFQKSEPISQPPGVYVFRHRSYRMHNPTAYKHIRQWFSPSFSYIQVPHSKGDLPCGQRFTSDIAYTTRAGQATSITYQVRAKGKLVETGQVDVTAQTNGGNADLAANCLLRQPITTRAPHTYPTLPTAVLRTVTPRNLEPMTLEEEEEPVYEEGEEFYTDDDDEDIPPPPEDDDIMIEPPILIDPYAPLKEPVVRSDFQSDLVSTFHLDFEVTAAMSPGFTLLVFHVMESGEVVADSRDFEVEPCFSNQVKMKFNTSQTLPGDVVTLSVEAAPGSVCGVGVVDKSVNLLGGNHQVTPQTVFKLLEELSWDGIYMNRWMPRRDDYCEKRMQKFLESSESELPEDITYWHYSSSYVDALQAFTSSGSIVVTNLDLETRPCEKRMPYVYAEVETLDSGPPPAVLRTNVAISGSPSKTTKFRTEFPETWLWDIVLIDDSGVSQSSLTAPHTVTSWVGNAMCVDQAEGFGVSPLMSLTTFQPFFISLHLPYAAIRGERLPVILTVYNYLEKCLNIDVKMDVGDAFDLSPRNTKAECVCGGKSRSVRFYVTPKSLGYLPITARAEVVPGLCGNDVKTETGYNGYTDGVIRKMLVKAEGVTQEYTRSMYMCPKSGGWFGGTEPVEEEVQLQLPDDIVKDSAIGTVRVIGDIMGPALTNLDNLVRMPTGCGEQNMVGFVPNIFVLKYLTNTGRLTEEVEKKAKKHMEIGYQRELNYRHKDGSYSAFGERDEQGSVWLTAFVVKSFAQAKQFVYIDEEDMELSIGFLRRSQLETGCYRETGKVFSSYMMGGLAKGKNKDDQTALTAYVLIALLQANVSRSERVIMSAVKCMNKKNAKDLRRMDTYTLSLVAYANSMYGEPLTKPDSLTVYENMLVKRAKTEGSFQFWQRDGAKPAPTTTWWYPAAPSAEVEMTSYVLMTFLRVYGDRAVEKYNNVVMWISQQRNPRGGFSSTQDTIVGLNALSEFAEKAYSSEPTELTVTVSGENVEDQLEVSESARTTLLLQSRPVSQLPNSLTVTTEGTGCALVQAHVQYNKMPNKILAKGEKPSFYLRVKTGWYSHDSDRCELRTLDVTVGARGSQKFSKGMSLLTLTMVTGWSPTDDSLMELRSKFPSLGIKRLEYKKEDATLTLYFDEISRKAKKFRIHVEQDEELRVTAPKPGQVKVFQYYETDVSLTRPYKLKTTCGTKAAIPRNKKFTDPPGVILQRRIEFDAPPMKAEISMAERTSRASNCPWCPESKDVPGNIHDIFCNSTAVYKAIAGRTGKFPIKLRQDFRPKKKQNVNKFVKEQVPDQCSCPNVQPKKKRVFIFVKKTFVKKQLNLDVTSTVLLANKNLEKEIRKLQKKCPIAA